MNVARGQKRGGRGLVESAKFKGQVGLGLQCFGFVIV